MATGNESKELSDPEPLEELPELDHVPDLDDEPDLESVEPDLASVEELSELEEIGNPDDASVRDESTGARKSGPRELEKAPMMLQKAALILTFAALLPWFVPGGWTGDRMIAKAIIALGGQVMYMGVLFAHEERVPGIFAKIGGMHRQALPFLGGMLMGLGVAPTFDSGSLLQTVVEKAALALGLITYCQVAGYAKGGKFNPMFGLVIPLFALAAVLRLVTVFVEFDLFALIGSTGVAAAGGLAGYTMFLAMKEAKAHGQQKKRDAMEARKKSRKQKRK